MLTMNNGKFEESNFALQIMSKGSFIDTGSNPNSIYALEATTVRLNWVAQNDWIMTRTSNCRDCYQDGPAGDAEWEAHKNEYADKRETWENNIKNAIGLEGAEGSIVIKQIQAEVFTVLHTWEITKKN